ncbi:DUF4097 family beta strand repeat-containing protein [Demequina aurantiaca]|uniref:DUF4097 family beta strand repeat-containing protein n=1 Tax=Demequina aurantiaca TaxID=676200 RepID=UPI000781CD49|nr:DUF4097 family beta strand repeat-containing protein [Demequina aurantiaca]
MPTFSTPRPIDLAVHLEVGALEVFATDRTDTVVTIAPTNPDNAKDRRGAQDTAVEFDGERLVITGPRPRFMWMGPHESVDIRVELPSGSRFSGELAVGVVRSVGRLGATRVKSSSGAVELDTTGDLWASASHGSVSVGDVDGTAEIKADMGQIRIGTVAGDASLKASHGTIMIERANSSVAANLSYGDLDVGKVLGSIVGKTAYGSIKVGEVSSGAAELESGFGQLSVGVLKGAAAWLDLSSTSGHVRNELDGDRAPASDEQTVSIRARTKLGDIRIYRAA